MRTDEMAAPSRDDRSTRRMEFPMVRPYPTSNGSATNRAKVGVAELSSLVSRFGISNLLNLIGMFNPSAKNATVRAGR